MDLPGSVVPQPHSRHVVQTRVGRSDTVTDPSRGWGETLTCPVVLIPLRSAALFCEGSDVPFPPGRVREYPRLTSLRAQDTDPSVLRVVESPRTPVGTDVEEVGPRPRGPRENPGETGGEVRDGTTRARLSAEADRSNAAEGPRHPRIPYRERTGAEGDRGTSRRGGTRVETEERRGRGVVVGPSRRCTPVPGFVVSQVRTLV